MPALLGDWLNARRALRVIAILLALSAWLIPYRQVTNLNDDLARRLTAFDTRGNTSRLPPQKSRPSNDADFNQNDRGLFREGGLILTSHMPC